jgi:hypothetical protein
MKNYKNYFIVILTGLLGLSISMYPTQGAAKKDSPARLIEYASCLASLSENSSTWDPDESASYDAQFSSWAYQTVSRCSKWKPIEDVNARSAQYKQCLIQARIFWPSRTLSDRGPSYLASELVRLQTILHEKCREYRP